MGTYTKMKRVLLTFILLFDWSGWERYRLLLPLVCVCPQICGCVCLQRERKLLPVCVCKCIHLCSCVLWACWLTVTVCECLSVHVGVCLIIDMCATCVWVCPLFLNLPLCTHILLLNRHTRHLAQPDAYLDVSELQTKVLPQNGHPGSPLARPRLREQLDQQDDRGQRSEWMEEERTKSVQKRDKRTEVKVKMKEKETKQRQ